MIQLLNSSYFHDRVLGSFRGEMSVGVSLEFAKFLKNGNDRPHFLEKLVSATWI